jgi:hypothetical protein
VTVHHSLYDLYLLTMSWEYALVTQLYISIITGSKDQIHKHVINFIFLMLYRAYHSKNPTILPQVIVSLTINFGTYTLTMY